MAADPITLAAITADIVAAYVVRNHVRAAELPTLIAVTHSALASLGTAPKPELGAAKPTPAVPIRKSYDFRKITSGSRIEARAASERSRNLHREAIIRISYQSRTRTSSVLRMEGRTRR